MPYKPISKLPCTICGKPSLARHLCRNHYYQAREAGTLERHAKIGPNEVFWSRVKKTHKGCWEWTGNKNDYGYGIFILPGEKRVRAHRYAFELTHGPIPIGLVIMHSCDNPPCINPAHLAAGPKSANNRDAVTKRRHAFGEKNGHARLTAEMVKRIRSDTRPQAEIAREYGVSQSHISRIMTRDVWDH